MHALTKAQYLAAPVLLLTFLPQSQVHLLQLTYDQLSYCYIIHRSVHALHAFCSWHFQALHTVLQTCLLDATHEPIYLMAAFQAITPTAASLRPEVSMQAATTPCMHYNCLFNGQQPLVSATDSMKLKTLQLAHLRHQPLIPALMMACFVQCRCLFNSKRHSDILWRG